VHASLMVKRWLFSFDKAWGTAFISGSQKNFSIKVCWSCELPLFLKVVLPCKGQTLLTVFACYYRLQLEMAFLLQEY
jgi:hypothetical protein